MHAYVKSKPESVGAVMPLMPDCRIAVMRRYGSVFDWDELGEMAPWPIEDADGVDGRREAVGLPPLAEQFESVRAAATAEGEPSPADPAARRREAEVWARSVGWRE